MDDAKEPMFTIDDEEPDELLDSTEEIEIKPPLRHLDYSFNREQLIRFGILIGLIIVIGVVLFISQLAIGYYVLENGNFGNENSTGGGNANFDVADYWANISKEVHSAMNHSVDPCIDFYSYACGGWIASTEIPDDKSSVSKSFTTISDANDIIIGKIMTDNWPMITTLYDDCMNHDLRNQLGAQPLTLWINMINEMDQNSFPSVLGILHRYGFTGFWNYDVSPDLLNPTVNIFELDQGGFGLPTNQYYFANSSDKVEAREAYKNRISNSLRLITSLVSHDPETFKSISQQTEDIFNFELRLASISLSPVERRNIEALYNPSELEYFKTNYSYLNWDPYFNSLGLSPNVSRMNVIVPSFFESLGSILQLDDAPNFLIVKNYLRWNIVRDSSQILSDDFFRVYFSYVEAIYGIDTPPPDSKICENAVNSVLGMLVGRYFLEEVWTDLSQEQAEELITAIKLSFQEELPNIDWMDSTTLNVALEKLAAVNDKVGHPTEWPSYEGLYIYPDLYFNNTIESWRYENDAMIRNADQPVDKLEWEMYPQTVNAYYNPQLNEMVFPAAILQPPIFNQFYPSPMNYGGIGSVMGHELTHGFDDQGRQFDATGAYRQWWTQSSIDNFNNQAQCVVDLYDQFEVQPGLYVNGAQTEGENIADMGGVKDAYRALQKALQNTKTNTKEQISKIFEMTPDQLFFVSYAQVWCSATRPEYEALLINVDVHSPAKARVNNPLSQFETFAKTFECPANTPMNPKDRCSVW